MRRVNKTAKEWILDQRLQNYGYDWKEFQKMSANKTRLKKKIRSMSDAEIRRNLAQAGIIGRGRRLTKVKPKKLVVKNGKKKWVADQSMPGYWDYTTGQSFNEELMNIMHVGSGKQNNWWNSQRIWN